MMKVMVADRERELTIVASRYKREMASVRGMNRGLSFFLDGELLQSLIVSVYEIDMLTRVLTLPRGNRTWVVDDLSHWLIARDTDLLMIDRTPTGKTEIKGGATWAMFEARELQIHLPDGCYESFLSKIKYALISAPERDGLPIYSLESLS